jgi:predicted esterase
MTVHVDHGVVYGPSNKLMDIYRSEDAQGVPVVLLWHGSGPDERDVLQSLARAMAEHGCLAYVPDWRSDAFDGGRAHLLESIAFMRQHASTVGGDLGRVLLAGWSRGAQAASGIAVDASVVDGWRPSGVACLATGYGRPTPTSPKVPLDVVAKDEAEPIPFWLLHGVNDELVEVEHSRGFAAVLREHAWPVHLFEFDTNHAGIVMTEYDPAQRRCVPATSDHAVEVGRRVAAILAEAAHSGASGFLS